MSRSDATIEVTCDGNACAERAARMPSVYPHSTVADLWDMGNGDWAAVTVDDHLRACGWTRVGDRDLCPECSKEGKT